MDTGNGFFYQTKNNDGAKLRKWAVTENLIEAAVDEEEPHQSLSLESMKEVTETDTPAVAKNKRCQPSASTLEVEEPNPKRILLTLKAKPKK